MSNAERILTELDARVEQPVDLTLYGRAALVLGFPDAPREAAQSLDVDAVLWTGQAEELAAHGNFWEAIERVNEALADEGLYISHFFEEGQVVLRPQWKDMRIRVTGPWIRLVLYRLANEDLLLSKLMRDDPIDAEDALFIARASAFSINDVRGLLADARVPDIPEIREQFDVCSKRLLAEMIRQSEGGSSC